MRLKTLQKTHLARVLLQFDHTCPIAAIIQLHCCFSEHLILPTEFTTKSPAHLSPPNAAAPTCRKLQETGTLTDVVMSPERHPAGSKWKLRQLLWRWATDWLEWEGFTALVALEGAKITRLTRRCLSTFKISFFSFSFLARVLLCQEIVTT